MKASTPKICADGSYATVEVTYKYKGKNYHERHLDYRRRQKWIMKRNRLLIIQV